MSYKKKEPKGMDTLKPYLATVRSQDSRQVKPQGEFIALSHRAVSSEGGHKSHHRPLKGTIRFRSEMIRKKSELKPHSLI